MKRCPKCGKQYSDDANFCPADAGHLETVADGTPSEIPAVDTAGHELLAGRFSLGEELGGHRTGPVRQASDKQGGAPCVVKFVDAAVFPTPLLLQRTERELKQLERCQSPRVVRVLDHGKTDDTLWIASERFEGTPLSQLVTSGGPLPEERVRTLLARIGEGLEEAAKLGVIHRDLAPKNVLVGPDDQIGLINFGVPVPGDERVQGVPEFVAPEVAEGKPIDQRCNIYSLGAIAYFAVTGAPPFTGSRDEVLRAHTDAEPAAPAGVSPGFAQLTLKALEKSSSKRFMTLRQLLGDLEQVDRPGAAEATAATEPMGGIGAAQGKGGAKTIPDTAKTLMGMPAMDVGGAASAPAGDDAAAAAPAEEPQAASEAPEPAAQAPEPAGPAPEPAAPAPAAPKVGAAAGGKKAGKAPAPEPEPDPERKKKGKFRETMWFKKGELDEAAAQAAAAKRKEDELASDRADELAIDERYEDDGSLSSQDRERLSLRTGGTQMMEAVGGQAELRSQVSERDLVSEMRAGRAKIIAGVVVGLCLLAAIIVYFAS